MCTAKTLIAKTLLNKKFFKEERKKTMKHAKKLASVLLALVMVFSLATTVFAASGTNDNTGKIYIDNANIGKDYNIYQILELESFDTAAGTYSYKATTAWKSFVKGDTVAGIYLDTDSNGLVTWHAGADVAAFATLAKTYADDTPIAATATKTATDYYVEFTDLSLGYYLVGSTSGTICSLNTTAKEIGIKDKNTEPTLYKEVQEDSTLAWGPSNDATIGDTINYKVSIEARDAVPANYVMHDKMDAGLTFNNDIVVKVNGTVKTAGTDYTVYTAPTDGDTFEITFNGVQPNDKIEVTYSAVLNKDAVISGSTNDNEAYLSYKDTTNTDKETTPSETKTNTFKFQLVKTKVDNTVLDGAQFKLYDAATGGNVISFIKESATEYRVAVAGESGTVDTIEAGNVVIKGLDTAKYYLEETKAPNGYNKLSSRVEVKIDAANLTANMIGTTTWDNGGVHVVNESGSLLPSTGGIGTTIFYILGSVLVLLAVVLLVTKKRMKVKE